MEAALALERNLNRALLERQALVLPARTLSSVASWRTTSGASDKQNRCFSNLSPKVRHTQPPKSAAASPKGPQTSENVESTEAPRKLSLKLCCCIVNPHPPFCGRVMGVPPSVFKNGDESFEDTSKNVEAHWAKDPGN
ncbi:hypothetical protein QTO34_005430 [Cnephaeus nilssonii]|uniref:Uncharacterized protein n=1 Tax=Cnephaeus nilssonii TaxID=3371016 RepID=A0AA40LIY9_CNENI|nr:hypothetical protein QTO34_005430 [Eptesicus nilssonii]